MKTYSEWLALNESRWSVRDELRAEVSELKTVYRETREGTPAETAAAFVAAVGYNRAAATLATLANRHGWDGRISRAVVGWAATIENAWNEDAAQHFGVYVDDVIHLAHFDQLARAFMKLTPPEDPTERPETISESEAEQETVQDAPEAVQQDATPAEPEAVQNERPESISETVAAPATVSELLEAAPRCGLLFDLAGDCLRYKTVEGHPRKIYTHSITAEGDAVKIRYFNNKFGCHGHGIITIQAGHECYNVAAVAAGKQTARAALADLQEYAEKLASVSDADAAYFRYTSKPAGKRKEEMKANMKDVSRIADQTACIIKNAPDLRECYKIRPLAGLIAGIAAGGIESGYGVTAAKHAAAVAEWLEKVADAMGVFKADEETETPAERPESISESEAEPEAVQDAPEAVQQDAAPEAEEKTFVMKEICFDLRNGGKNEKRVIYSQTGDRLAELPEAREVVQQDATPAEPEATAERPETISEDLPAPAPVVALLAPVPAPAADADRKAAPRRQAPPKPARGPGKPLDFSGQTITGDGWQIVFDAALQRTRVIIQEADRAKLAPLAEAAGFYYSVNTDSWHKKLTHKARRAALALADAFRAAVAAA